MPITETHVHYAATALAILLGGSALGAHVADKHQAPVYGEARISRFDWPGLGQDKTTALGEALKNVPPGKVTFFCSASTCHSLYLDLDDAFQIAEWTADFQPAPVESELDKGIFVGPPGPEADHMIAVIKETTGLEAKVVGIDGIEGLGIIIGKVAK